LNASTHWTQITPSPAVDFTDPTIVSIIMLMDTYSRQSDSFTINNPMNTNRVFSFDSPILGTIHSLSLGFTVYVPSPGTLLAATLTTAYGPRLRKIWVRK